MTTADDNAAEEFDELRLTQKAQSGDVYAFELLMKHHIRRVRAYISLRAPADHLIDDITHDTFVYAYQHLQEFTAGTALGAWLRAIATISCEQRYSDLAANELLLKYAEQQAPTCRRLGQSSSGANDDHYLMESLSL